MRCQRIFVIKQHPGNISLARLDEETSPELNIHTVNAHFRIFHHHQHLNCPFNVQSLFCEIYGELFKNLLEFIAL